MSTNFLDMSGFEEEDVTLSPIMDNDDEVFLIRVPKGYDIEKLDGIGEYSPPGIIQIEAKEGKRGLVSVVELGAFGGKDLDINLLINSGNKITAGPCVKQSLCVSRSVHLNPSAASKSVDVGASSPVLMPSGLKPRFTPFGAGCPVPNKLKKDKKHKTKKRKRDEVPDTLLNNNHTSFSGSDTSNTINHLCAEKRPSTSKSDIMRSEEGISETSPPVNTSRRHKKKKKRKSEPDDFLEHNSHANYSSNAVESSGEEVKYFDSASNKKKKRKSGPIGLVSNMSQPSLISSNSHEEPTMNSFVNSPQNKKKKNKSVADDQVFHDTSTHLLSLEVREGTSSELENTQKYDKEKKRGHKRKLSSGYQSLESSLVLDESVSIDPTSAERKHKKKKIRKEHDTYR